MAAERAAQLVEATRYAIFIAAREAMRGKIEQHGGLPFEEDVREIALSQINSYDIDMMFKARDIDMRSYLKAKKQLLNSKTSLAEVFLILFETTICDYIKNAPHTMNADPLLLAAQRLRIDTKAIESRIKAEFSAGKPE